MTLTRLTHQLKLMGLRRKRCQTVCNNANLAEKILPIARDGNCDAYSGGYFKSLCFATINLFEILKQTDFKTENIYYKTQKTHADDYLKQ